MSFASESGSVLSREELDALLEEMPSLLGDSGGASESSGSRAREVDVELQRANEEFAFDQGHVLSNRHQRVITASLIGHREIEMPELAELMLPTDLAVAYRVMPSGFEGFLLLSRPLFFQMLCMSFGAGPSLKPIRPPVRDYSRIERRFYERTTREMLGLFESAWRSVAPLSLEWIGLAARANVAESEPNAAILATFDVKGFQETCRIRMSIPVEAFVTKESERARDRGRGRTGPEVSVLEVPISLRARVGTADLSLAEVGALEPGQLIEVDAPSDGALTIQIGDRDKFRAIAGTQGGRRAVQLTDRLEGAE